MQFKRRCRFHIAYFSVQILENPYILRSYCFCLHNVSNLYSKCIILVYRLKEITIINPLVRLVTVMCRCTETDSNSYAVRTLRRSQTCVWLVLCTPKPHWDWAIQTANDQRPIRIPIALEYFVLCLCVCLLSIKLFNDERKKCMHAPNWSINEFHVNIIERVTVQNSLILARWDECLES